MGNAVQSHARERRGGGGKEREIVLKKQKWIFHKFKCIHDTKVTSSRSNILKWMQISNFINICPFPFICIRDDRYTSRFFFLISFHLAREIEMSGNMSMEYSRLMFWLRLNCILRGTELKNRIYGFCVVTESLVSLASWYYCVSDPKFHFTNEGYHSSYSNHFFFICQ